MAIMVRHATRTSRDNSAMHDVSSRAWNEEHTVTGVASYTKNITFATEALGRPNANPPNIVIIDNVELLSFTVDTDRVFIKFPIPTDYDSGDWLLRCFWTNDGGVDDNGKNSRWQYDYQVTDGPDNVISGDHANSPRAETDAYPSDLGWVGTFTTGVTIPEAEVLGKHCFFLKLSAITAPAVVLTCEPHLIGFCLTYTALINRS